MSDFFILYYLSLLFSMILFLLIKRKVDISFVVFVFSGLLQLFLIFYAVFRDRQGVSIFFFFLLHCGFFLFSYIFKHWLQKTDFSGSFSSTVLEIFYIFYYKPIDEVNNFLLNFSFYSNFRTFLYKKLDKISERAFLFYQQIPFFLLNLSVIVEILFCGRVYFSLYFYAINILSYHLFYLFKAFMMNFINDQILGLRLSHPELACPMSFDDFLKLEFEEKDFRSRFSYLPNFKNILRQHYHLSLFLSSSQLLTNMQDSLIRNKDEIRQPLFFYNVFLSSFLYAIHFYFGDFVFMVSLLNLFPLYFVFFFFVFPEVGMRKNK